MAGSILAFCPGYLTIAGSLAGTVYHSESADVASYDTLTISATLLSTKSGTSVSAQLEESTDLSVWTPRGTSISLSVGSPSTVTFDHTARFVRLRFTVSGTNSLATLTATGIGRNNLSATRSHFTNTSDTFAKRSHYALATYLRSPIPDLDTGSGKLTWALVGLFAPSLLLPHGESAGFGGGHDGPSRRWFFANPNDVIASYFELPYIPKIGPGWSDLGEGEQQPLLRLYSLPDTYQRLTDSNKSRIAEHLFTLVTCRSHLEDTVDPWRVSGSENHNALRRSALFLAILRLVQTPGYGPDCKLDDGNTLQIHLDAWSAYFKEYFRQRAREGLLCEINSPIYNRYTLLTWYNVRDIAVGSVTKRLADQAITLLWADAAQEFISTGIRGGGETRCYKNQYLTRGYSSWIRPWSWLYGWHDDTPLSFGPTEVLVATSNYQPPAIVTAIATAQKAPYNYVARRHGQGTTDHPITRCNQTGTEYTDIRYNITFDAAGNSSVCSRTYYTPDYVIGSISFNPSLSYIALTRQSRAATVMFSSDVDARIMVAGKGTLHDGIVGYGEINAISRGGAMIVARDPSVESDTSDGTRIFVSYAGSVWESWHPTISGWYFGQSGDAYYAVRIAHKPIDDPAYYNETKVPAGRMLDLTDMWSPIVIQMGRVADYPTIRAFKDAVRALTFTFNSKDNGGDDSLRYTGLSGATFVFWRDSFNLPLVNETSGLNPNRTYDSPYIKMDHGASAVTISYPGSQELTLNFDY